MAAFALVALSPIDPLQANIGQVALGSMSAEQVARLQAYWGVGQPLIGRYLNWLSGFLRGDLGVSLLYRQEVSQVIAEKCANSVWLMGFAWCVSGVLGIALGVTAGVRRGRFSDRLIRGGCLLVSSTPAFWIALMALIVFAVWLGWFPIGLSIPIGMDAARVSLADRLHHAALPALVLSITGIPNVALHTREKMVEVLESDYVLFARARGERTTQIVLRHGLRNILLPAITLQFGAIGEIFGGSTLIEQVFSYPGLGQAAVAAGLGSDLPLLMGIAVISAVIVFGGNLAADLLYGVVDPRVRKGGAHR